MECKNCGREIPDDSKKCKYCKQPIIGRVAQASSTISEKKTKRKTGTEVIEALKGTIPEGSLEKQNVLGEECPECHLQLEDGKCPRCEYKKEDIKEEPKSEKKKASTGCETIRWNHESEIENGTFVLNPLSAKTGMTDGEPLTFTGTEIGLTRENTAPGNKTITSKVQAVLGIENGEWYILDKSELKSTFVQASRPIPLEDGQQILLGSQLYEFRVQK